MMMSHAVRKSGLAESKGDVVGQFVLLEKIGDGGFGSVWRAEQTDPVRREVALKIVKPGMDTLEVIGRFEQERSALALMEHPNIAHVFDAGATPAGRPFFVMELVRGVPITTFCIEKQLPLEQRLALFKAVCAGVQHAHQKGIIHRDLKPSNILVVEVDGVPVPKIIDFGIAKATSPDRLTALTLATRMEQVIGTPLYMSPEQAAASPDIDTRSDVYALGVLLYELLTGQPPFDVKTLMSAGYEEMRRIIQEQPPPPPSKRNFPNPQSEIRIPQSRDLDLITLRALEKDRTRRYASATAFAEDIQRFLNHEPVEARAPSPGYLVRRWARRHRAAAAAIGVSLAAIVTGASLAVWQAARATAAQREAEQHAAEARKNATEARRQLADADQATQVILGTLSGLLDYGAPPTIQRTELMRQMLDRVHAFKGDPLRKALMLSSIADSVWAGESIPLRAEALALAEPLLGANDRQLWAYRYHLARAKANEGSRRAEVIPELLRILEWHRAHLGADDRATSRIDVECAYHLFAIGQHARAVELFAEGFRALAIDPAGTSRRAQIFFRASYTSALDQLGRHDEALAMGRENARAAIAELKVSPSYDAARALIQHAVLLRDNHQPDEAITAARQALDAILNSSGPLDVVLTPTINLLAELLQKKGGTEALLALQRDMVQEFDTRLGPAHAATALRMKGYSLALVAAGRAKEADKLATDWLRRVRQSDGALPAPCEEVLRGHIAVLRDLPDYPRAESALRDLIAIVAKNRPRDLQRYGDQSNLADVLIKENRPSEAVPLLEETVQVLTQRGAENLRVKQVHLEQAKRRLAEAQAGK